MNTVPLSGTDTKVSFFPDDTIDTVRQLVALNVGSHPDRLFIEVKAKLPAYYYSSDPRNWTDLFVRMSFDGRTVTSKVFRSYLERMRPGSGVEYRDITREDWESHPDDLQKLFNPEHDFEEWRILGVESGFVMPIPAEDLPELQETRIPLPRRQSLFETLHPYEVTEFRATEIPADASDLIRMKYTPFLTSETPANVEGFRNQIEGSQKQLNALLGLGTPKHTSVSVLRAKWFVPWVSTRFAAPHTRFEQIFYGMTLSEDTPYIGFFTGKDEAMRHKFYVKDPKTKKPFLDVAIWKSWLASTQPQRRLPTLLLYRGNSDRSHFDRIAITSKDITLSTVRSKDNEESLEDLQNRLHIWLLTLDALMPFVRPSDVHPSRWELGDLTAHATYKTELRDLDLLRFGCLQNLFGIQGNTFRLLRAEHGSTDMSPQDLQAYQILTDEDVVPSAELLQQEMGISAEAANDLLEKFKALQDEKFNFEKDIKGYPIIKFGGKDVTITFVSNLQRVLRYVDILRYVVTPGSDSEELNQVCPRRMEEVAAAAVVPQQMAVEEDAEEEFDDFGDIEGGARKMKVEEKRTGTYNYFNERLQKFNPEVFDKALYPKKCDKPRQVVVLTPADKERIVAEKGEEYTFSDVPENEAYEMEDPEGTAICPPFWCMRDEIPLREDQLEDGACPVCGGKLRSSDSEDPTVFTVIARDGTTKYPKLMEVGEKKFPCCYKKPSTVSTILAVPSTDDTYVLTGTNVPELRLAYISDDLASRLGLKTGYGDSIGNGRLIAGKKDVFRLGIGRPSKTLPLLIKGPAIKQPKDARDKVKLCSFYRTWSDMGAGASQEDRILDGIQRAYESGTMNVMDELEYVTTFLQTSVMRMDTRDNRLICGFWSDVIDPATRTILMLDNDILTLVSRRKQKRGPKFDYEANIHKMTFSKQGMTSLLTNYRVACATNIPSFDDAVAELQAVGKVAYQIIEDPFKRAQALLVPGEIILPFRPITRETIAGVVIRSGYADVKDEELPTGVSAREFLKTAKHPGYKVSAELQNVRDQIVELLLTSGFRVPIQPENTDVDDVPREVLETIRKKNELSLTTSEPNAADIKLAREIMYSAEVYEFLLYSLSKDVQRAEYETLRRAIEGRTPELAKELKDWLKKEAHWDDSISPPEFVNKVRTPCGQLINKDSCSKSTLCGWHRGSCKIRVKPIVDKDAMLRRVIKTLMENDKQRALVLDERLSPFFSTVLYLELPHELITSDV